MSRSRPVYRVITGIYPPFVMYNATNGAFSGYCIDLLNDIASLMGFDYIVEGSYQGFHNYRDPITGLWYDIINELTKNVTDIAVGPIWISSFLAKVRGNFDFDASYRCDFNIKSFHEFL
ncbi:Ionotropic receptor 25a [Anthophora quadrimaculata]